MKITIKLKFSFQKIVRYLYFAVAIFAAIALYSTFYFLYKNFYITITQSGELINLRGAIVDEIVDMDKYDAVIKNLEDKTKKRELGNINNPFD